MQTRQKKSLPVPRHEEIANKASEQASGKDANRRA